MLSEVGKTIYEQSENFNKEIEYTNNYQTEITLLKNTITELKKINKGVQQQTKSCRKKIRDHENRH